MKRITFGKPEDLKPSVFCKNFSYVEKEIKYPIDKIKFKQNARGCVLTMPLAAEEQIYGAGLQLQMFNLRGHRVETRVNSDPVLPSGDSHAPVPFFVSTKGYGVYVDTARYVEFHFGNSELLRDTNCVDTAHTVAVSTEELYSGTLDSNSEIAIQIPAVKGIDIYIIEGDTITDIVAQYNMLSGGGCSVPEWGLSPIYRCYSRYNSDEVINAAKSLKDNDFKVGIIGLEPGWQTRSYSCSFVWNSENFPNPQETITKLNNMGYHINLWEHAFTHPSSPIYKSLLPYSSDYVVWQGCIPDFATEEARKIFAEHHKKIIDMGIDGFKLDECDGSDFKMNHWSFPNFAEFPSGLDGEQYHSLFGVLYMQTMLEALGDNQTLSEVRNAGALSASYPFVLYSDLYDHSEFIRGCATSGFSGILWSPEVRDATTKEEFLRRLQTNVFSVQCLINAWYCEKFPWIDHDCSEEVKELLRIREQLIPMLKSAFDKYKNSGIPPVRALVSDYTDDKNTYNIDDEYIFCDNLIVAPISVGNTEREVYLPDGKWVDYFTKEPVSSGYFTVKTDFIPVYEKVQ